MPRTPREVGAYGNKRGVEAQRRRRELRLQKPRVAQALKVARGLNKAIDEAVIDLTDTSTGRPTLTYQRPSAPAPRLEPDAGREPAPTRRRLDWTVRDVLQLLRDGYSVKYVARRTGYDRETVAALAEQA